MKKEITDKWISTDEATEYLGVKATTIREWIRKDNGILHTKSGVYRN
ncbi:excisionase family DNA-binding protein [Mesomycoplasma ovipneumoniae]